MVRLTDRAVKSLKAGRHGDGDGLHLVVSSTGRRKWILRYQRKGVRRDMGLGAYPATGLAEARALAADARRLLAKGTDPLAARGLASQAPVTVPTFGAIAEIVIEDAIRRSTNAKVQYQWRRHLGRAYCGPILDRPITEITVLDVAGVLRPVWDAKPEVARKLYPAIRRVFDHGRIILRDTHGIQLSSNPARWDDLKAIGFEKPKQLSKGNHPSLSHNEMSQFFDSLGQRVGTAAQALQFLILTNVRTDAVLKARWEEIDLGGNVWTIPLANLKDRKHRNVGFRVPLAGVAVAQLMQMRETRQSDLLFPAHNPERPLSNMAMLTLLKRMNAGERPRWIDVESRRPITPHGFRATFRTWAEESTGFPHAVIEEAMGHQVGTKVERAYRRTDALTKRRELMDAWASYCTTTNLEA